MTNETHPLPTERAWHELRSASLYIADTVSADLAELRRRSELVADAAVGALQGRTVETVDSIRPYVHLANVASVRPLTDR